MGKIYHEKIDARFYEYRVEMNKPNMSQAGLYKCVIANDHGQMQVYLTLDLDSSKTRPPTFLETPSIVTLNKGKVVQMIGRYDAAEKCQCSWSNKGEALSEGRNIKIFHEKINNAFYEYRVEIQDPNKANSGLYRCQVKNGYGQ